MLQANLMVLPSAQKALEVLDKLRKEVRDAPSFKALEVAAATAEAIQKRFRPVQEVADRAGEVWTEAEIKLRDELDKLEKPRRGKLNTGPGPGRGKKGKKTVNAESELTVLGADTDEPGGTIPFSRGGPTLKELGIAPKRASRAKQLKAIPPKLRQKYIDQLKDEGAGVTPNAILKKHKEQEREKKRKTYSARVSQSSSAESLTKLIEAEQKFSVIYADPPWTFETYSGKGKERSAERHYDTMSLTALAAMPVRELAGDDCALFLWAVCPELPGALDIIKAWGFSYKTVGFVWVKTTKNAESISLSGDGLHWGMGYWTRANAELCLLATKGSPTRLAMDVPQIIISPVGEHSAKPEETRKRIERLLPGPYLELFARGHAERWTTWGNEV
jgi:N6-adenosine-specific RNA methylase IME4